MITGLYGALFAFFYIKLSFDIITVRKRENIGLGDGGHAQLINTTRAHANFIEYTPFAILLLFILEMQNFNKFTLHTAGITFLLARVIHWQALKRENLRLRVIGMALTFLVLLTLGVANLILYVN
jgi:uncharacterized membrane protein YecN with MAPEG domain